MFWKTGECSKLNMVSLGVALGLTKGLYMMLLAWAGWAGGYGLPMIHHIAEYHRNYAPDLVGGLMGGLWGFVCGFIAGFVIAFFYNWCLCCPVCKKFCKKK